MGKILERLNAATRPENGVDLTWKEFSGMDADYRSDPEEGARDIERWLREKFRPNIDITIDRPLIALFWRLCEVQKIDCASLQEVEVINESRLARRTIHEGVEERGLLPPWYVDNLLTEEVLSHTGVPEELKQRLEDAERKVKALGREQEETERQTGEILLALKDRLPGYPVSDEWTGGGLSLRLGSLGSAPDPDRFGRSDNRSNPLIPILGGGFRVDGPTVGRTAIGRGIGKRVVDVSLNLGPGESLAYASYGWRVSNIYGYPGISEFGVSYLLGVRNTDHDGMGRNNLVAGSQIEFSFNRHFGASLITFMRLHLSDLPDEPAGLLATDIRF